MLDVSRTCISNWENGTRTPDFVTMSKLSIILNVSLEYLLCRTTQENNPLKKVGIDVSRLNSKGIEALTQYYRFLLTDESLIEKNNR